LGLDFDGSPLLYESYHPSGRVLQKNVRLSVAPQRYVTFPALVPLLGGLTGNASGNLASDVGSLISSIASWLGSNAANPLLSTVKSIFSGLTSWLTGNGGANASSNTYPCTITTVDSQGVGIPASIQIYQTSTGIPLSTNIYSGPVADIDMNAGTYTIVATYAGGSGSQQFTVTASTTTQTCLVTVTGINPLIQYLPYEAAGIGIAIAIAGLYYWDKHRKKTSYSR